jgi:hypothetical protein
MVEGHGFQSGSKRFKGHGLKAAVQEGWFKSPGSSKVWTYGAQETPVVHLIRID